jgi:hypothetical protein
LDSTIKSLHDNSNVKKLRLAMNKCMEVVDRYLVNAEIITAMATRERGRRPFKRHRNIYSDILYITEGDGEQLSNQDLLELKEIYYSTYYDIPDSVSGYQSTTIHGDNHGARGCQLDMLKHNGRGYKVTSGGHAVMLTRNMSTSGFRQFVVRSNVLEEMESLERMLECFVEAYDCPRSPTDKKKVAALLNKYKSIQIHHRVEEDTYDVCECGTKMAIQSNSSEMMCLRCGMMTKLIGSVTEESQLFAQEGNRVAHGSYDPSRHCKFWIERIQAKESTVIPEVYINKIKESIKKDRLSNIKNISVKQFRMYLKQNDLSKLNDHIPLIKKIITGYIPPQLTHMEMQLLFIYFDKATKTYEAIKPNNKKNSLYYPFLIYKILDIIIKDEDKKRGLLSSIHLQSYETLVENDTIWQQICAENKCFNYRPTNHATMIG